MKVTFHIPLFLKPLAGDQSELELRCDGCNAGEVLRALFVKYPGLGDRVMTEQGAVRPHVNVFVGEESIRFMGGLEAPVKDGDVITLLPAVSGGCFDGARPTSTSLSGSQLAFDFAQAER